LYAIGLPIFPTPMNPTVTAIGHSLVCSSIHRPRAPRPAQRMLTLLSAYCSPFSRQNFSSVILRNERTSACVVGRFPGLAILSLTIAFDGVGDSGGRRGSVPVGTEERVGGEEHRSGDAVALAKTDGMALQALDFQTLPVNQVVVQGGQGTRRQTVQ